jgi:hypothetical protein
VRRRSSGATDGPLPMMATHNTALGLAEAFGFDCAESAPRLG